MSRAPNRGRPRRMALAARGAACLLAAAVASCLDPVSPPTGSTRFAPPAVYADWWGQLEACSGLSGNLSRIAWYEVPSTPGVWGFQCGDHWYEVCLGEWRSSHQIWLAGPSDAYPGGHVYDEFTVKHEMLHDLTGSAQHGPLFSACVKR
jgi:hypothetical protein